MPASSPCVLGLLVWAIRPDSWLSLSCLSHHLHLGCRNAFLPSLLIGLLLALRVDVNVCCTYLNLFFSFLCIFFKHVLLLYVCEYMCLYKSKNNWNYFNPSPFYRFQEFPSAHQGCAASASTLWGIWEILADDALLCSIFWHCPGLLTMCYRVLICYCLVPPWRLLDSSFCLSLGFGLNMRTSFLLVPYVCCLPSLIYFHNVTSYSVLKPSLLVINVCWKVHNK